MHMSAALTSTNFCLELAGAHSDELLQEAIDTCPVNWHVPLQASHAAVATQPAYDFQAILLCATAA